MAEKSVTYRLLSLFTSPDRAESIEGDLIEERHTYGRLWFAVNVVTTVFALWRQALALDFLRTVALSVVAVALSCLLCAVLELIRVELALGVSPVTTLLPIPAFAFLLGARALPVSRRRSAFRPRRRLAWFSFSYSFTRESLRAAQFRDIWAMPARRGNLGRACIVHSRSWGSRSAVLAAAQCRQRADAWGRVAANDLRANGYLFRDTEP